MGKVLKFCKREYKSFFPYVISRFLRKIVKCHSYYCYLPVMFTGRIGSARERHWKKPRPGNLSKKVRPLLFLISIISLKISPNRAWLILNISATYLIPRIDIFIDSATEVHCMERSQFVHHSTDGTASCIQGNKNYNGKQNSKYESY
jgi:hypothetical protein